MQGKIVYFNSKLTVQQIMKMKKKCYLHPNNMVTQPNIFSAVVVGAMFPKPMVVKLVSV